jgi:hypothetical protein
MPNALYPNLPSAGDRPTPSEQPRTTSPLAASMWPSLLPPKPVAKHILVIRQLLKETNAALRAEKLGRR